MSENRKNMELYFEEKIKRSLQDKTSEHFTSNLMHKVSLEMQFAQEDKKTEKMTKKFIGAIAMILLGLSIVFGYFIVNQGETQDSGTSFAEDISFTINKYIYEIQAVLGVQLDFRTLLFGLSLIFIIAIYSFSDRFIFRRR